VRVKATAKLDGTEVSEEAQADAHVIDGLTVLPEEAYVCVGGTKDFEAWIVSGGARHEVTASSTFDASRDNLMNGDGDNGEPDNHTLTASDAPSASEGSDWVRATYQGQTADAAHDCNLTVIKVELTRELKLRAATAWAGRPRRGKSARLR